MYYFMLQVEDICVCIPPTCKFFILFKLQIVRVRGDAVQNKKWKQIIYLRAVKIFMRKRDGSYRGFGYLNLASDPLDDNIEPKRII